MIPNELWSTDTTHKPYATYGLAKPLFMSANLFHLHMGPPEFSASWGNHNLIWWCFEYAAGVVIAHRWTGEQWEYYGDVCALPALTAFTANFDQNGRPLVFFSEDSNLRLWWYDPVAAANTLTSLGAGSSPFCTLDIKYGVDTEYSDVLLFYVRSGAVYYRVQRERYAVEKATSVTAGARKIFAADMSEDYHMQILYLE